MKKILPLAAALLMVSAVAFAAPAPLKCPQKAGGDLAVNNEQVLGWMRDSSKEFIRARAHISGKVVKVLPPDQVKNPEKEPDRYKRKHQRFDVKIGPAKEDVIQVFYNGKYTPRPALKKGDMIEACGEFAADHVGDPKFNNHFSLVYWVHSASSYPHPEGYLQAQGQTFGAKVATK